MASRLLLIGSDGAASDVWKLDDRDEENLATAFRNIALHAVERDHGVLVHERDGRVIAAWNAEGAARFAQLLPPAYDELAGAIDSRVRG